MTGADLREYVAAGCGYVPDDGSEHTCGDMNGSGKVCFMFLAGQKRCAILGKQEITPSMTCIYDVTGKPLPDDYKAQELLTPAEAGLTDTVDGATCKRCDFSQDSGKGPVCALLTMIQSHLAGPDDFDVKDADKEFTISPGSCCSFWKRDGVELPIR